MLRRAILAVVGLCLSTTVLAVEPVPEKLVVLTFDDSVKSHFTVVRPILKRYKFGATFFITEGFDFPQNKTDYMTWDEIALLHRDGFEIGNHTGDHLAISDATVGQLDEQLTAIEKQCELHKIPCPVSFAYPGNTISVSNSGGTWHPLCPSRWRAGISVRAWSRLCLRAGARSSPSAANRRRRSSNLDNG